jgi:hypothetical protein
MPEISGADPTRPVEHPSPTEPPDRLPVPVSRPFPGRRIAPLGLPETHAGPDPTDLLLFKDASGGPDPLHPGSPGGDGSGGYGPDVHGPDDTGWTTWPADRNPLEQRRVVRVLAMAGVIALACGLAIMAAQPEQKPEPSAAPVADSTTPGPPALPGLPSNGAGAGPGLVEPGPPGTSRPEAGADTPELQHRVTDKEPLPGTAAAAPSAGSDGAAEADGKSQGKEKGKGDSSDTDSGTGGSGTGSEGVAATDTPPSSTTRRYAIQAVNYPDRYWHLRNGTGYLDQVGRSTAALTVTAGLADPDCYSFSVGSGRYLRHASFRLRADADDGSALFERDATFCARAGVHSGSVMLESHNYPGRFIRHRDFQLRLDPYQNTSLYRADSTFRMVDG